MGDYKRIYVWEWSVRFFHWVNALCIVVLSVTGYLIGEPRVLFISPEAYNQFWFGTLKSVHFTTAYIFTFNIIFRLYWSFVGNRYSKWSNYIPHNKGQVKEFFKVIRMDVFLGNIKGKLSIGHNNFAFAGYFLIMLVSILQIITGFALYDDMSAMSLGRLLGGVVSVAVGAVVWRYFRPRGLGLSLGIGIVAALVSYFIFYYIIDAVIVGVPFSDITLRNIHHIIMWGFWVFFIIHIYLVFYHDYLEGRGVMSSIVGGWKFVKEREIDVDKK